MSTTSIQEVGLHIRIHKRQDRLEGLCGAEIAGGGGALALAGAEQIGAGGVQPGRRFGRAAVEDEQGLITRPQALQRRLGAAAEGGISADGGHHQGEGGDC